MGTRLNTPINTEELEQKAAAAGDSEFKPIPEGKYNARIVECREEIRQAGMPKTDNTQLVFKFRITDGQYAKRTFFWQCFTSYNNMKPGAEGVFSRQLNNLVKATGVQGAIEDTDDFLNRECIIQINLEKDANDNDKEKNVIDGNKFEPLAMNTRGSVRNEQPATPARTQSTYSASNPPAPPRRRG